MTTILCGIAIDNLNKNYKFEIFNSHMMIKMSEEVANIGILQDKQMMVKWLLVYGKI